MTLGASLTLLVAEIALAEGVRGTSAAQVTADEATINIVAQKLCQADPAIGTRIAVRRKCDTPAQVAHFRQQAREIIEEYKRRPCMAGTGAGPNDTPLPC